jgi:hypothetical protein
MSARVDPDPTPRRPEVSVPTAERTVLTDDYQRMLFYVEGMWVSQCMRSVAALSIADHLQNGPQTADRIAEAASADPDAVFRLMRACVALDVLTFDPSTGCFAGTGLLDTLRKDAPQSLWAMAQVQPAPGHWKLWAEAPEAVRTGRTQADLVHGMSIFEYFGAQPEEARIFSRAMADLTGPIAPEAAAVIDTSQVRRVIDLGGADGTFCYDVLHHSPGADGVVHDLPHVVDHALAERDRRGLTDRVTVEAGDFFDSVPVGDLYLLKFVMHDWTDADCVRILANCRKAMNPGGRVCIVDMVVGTTDAPGIAATMMDVNMLVVTGGRERDLAQFDGVLEAAGLQRVRTTPISSPYSAIEAVAV